MSYKINESIIYNCHKISEWIYEAFTQSVSFYFVQRTICFQNLITGSQFLIAPLLSHYIFNIYNLHNSHSSYSISLLYEFSIYTLLLLQKSNINVECDRKGKKRLIDGIVEGLVQKERQTGG